MAGESARFGLRDRPPTPAIRRFDLPPRLKPMLDRANAGLAEAFSRDQCARPMATTTARICSANTMSIMTTRTR